jgi:hypothetical protein
MEDRARVGINLGFSPQHARHVHLILSLTTGCVSPQFHCKFDNHFMTLQQYQQPMSLWQEKAQFVQQKENHEDNTPIQHSSGTSTTASVNSTPREDFNPQDDFRGIPPEERFTVPAIPNEEEATQRNEGANNDNNEPVMAQENQDNT